MTESTVQPESDSTDQPPIDPGPTAADNSEAPAVAAADKSVNDDGGASAASAETPEPKATGSEGASLTVMVRRLLRDCPSKQSIYDTVLNVCRERLPASVVRADYRVGAVMLSEIRHDDRIAEPAAKKFSEKFLSQLAQEVRDAKVPEPRFKRFERGDQQMMIAAAPVMDLTNNTCDGVMSLMLAGGGHQPEFILPMLDGVTATVTAALASKSALTAKKEAETKAAAAPTQAAAQPAVAPVVAPEVAALSRAAKFSNLKEFGYTLVNTVSNQLQCEQVSFGAEANSKIKVHAISGVADFKASSPGVASIRQAMEECLDEQGPVAFPEIAESGESTAIQGRPIHQQWSTECNHSATCSLPLMDGRDVVAVVSLRRSGHRPFTQADVAALESTLKSYGPAVRVVERAGQPVGSRLKTAVQDKASGTMKKGAWGRKIALVAFLLATAWFFFGTLTYKPLCRSTITAANLRHYSAPFDGQLKAVLVKPGQRVSEGDVLVQFDTSDLELEQYSLQRQISALEVQVKQAVSEDDLAQAAMANARLGVLSTDLAAVQKRIAEATVTAPSNGVVVLNDLQQRIGQAFPQGEEILQFVVDGDWLLEIEVPDNIVSLVTAEQQGIFAPASDPTNKHEFQIQHVDGAASVIEDRNVFLARATFGEQPEAMMTGMEGTSKLITVDRPVWWVALHGVIDWARMNFWL